MTRSATRRPRRGRRQGAAGNHAAREQLLPFLLNPNSYAHRPRRVELVQTHSSFVFLAPPFVFKVKKPVNFGFLDFSTLEKRRHFCEREVWLNRRLCPRVYLGVVPISRRGAGLAFGPGDAVVEYAVQMRHLSAPHFLKRLLRQGRVGPREIGRVAAALADFYAAQDPTPEISAWGRVDRLKISTDENFRQTAEFIGDTISPAAYAAIRAYTDGFYRRRRALFAARVRQRRIRDCHGDLHLDHIHLTPRALHIYDCIEFNDRFRYIDVAEDVAFLAMDLDFEGRPDLARLLVTRMARALRDPGLLELMDFYKCYRAYVRGKVESLHSRAKEAPEAERDHAREKARRYFRLALRYAVAGSGPLVLALMGRLASGKSALAEGLSAELGWPVASSDRVRKELAGVPLFERTEAARRARLYAPAMTRRTYTALLRGAAAEVRHGRGAVLDATFGRRRYRDRLRARFRRSGVPVVFIEAAAPARVLKRRLERRETQAGVVSDARLEDFAALDARYEPPTELSAAERLRIQTTRTAAASLTAALTALARLNVRRVAGGRGNP